MFRNSILSKCKDCISLVYQGGYFLFPALADSSGFPGYRDMTLSNILHSWTKHANGTLKDVKQADHTFRGPL